MTRLYNDENDFRLQFLEGLVAAYHRYLRVVPGGSGVVSRTAGTPGRVGMLIGGGSGHYPAFAGLVGPGLCDGAVVGEIFTSPSAEDVYRCINAVDGGSGVLISFGNYSGDVMHFGLAAQRARREGIDVRIVLVTDDVASAPPEQRASRRGVAGGFFVYRAAAAAAHAGFDLDETERVARTVNAATTSIGVSFAGCTFPGSSEPLFHISLDKMAVGLGIHGEPGIDLVPRMSADEVAGLMLASLLAERPEGANRAQVLINGLGATKYEELFVLYRSVSTGLIEAGVTVVSPEVGEYVTSLDMAGCSLSLCWTTDEIQALLSAPASAPGFRTPSEPMPPSDEPLPNPLIESLPIHDDSTNHAPRTPAALRTVAAVQAMSTAIEAAKHELGRLDSVAGDGDHGLGMSRGMRAAATAAALAGPEPSNVLDAAGLAFSEAAGGASGALWGAALCAVGHHLAGADTFTTETIHDALESGLGAISELGGAVVGDKTMVDAAAPFVHAMATVTVQELPAAWTGAARVATEAAAATAGMVSRKGRAAVHGEHSRGTPDPGAVSFALAMTAAGRALQEEER